VKFIKASEAAFDPRPQMGKIFAEGFYDHGLKYFAKDKTKLARAMAHIFDLESFYLAVEGEAILALIGCTNKKPPPIAMDKAVLVRELGFLAGRVTYRMLNKHLVNHTYPFELMPGTGSIEFVATAAQHRGKGAAHDLLAHVMEISPYNEYVLEVMDVNTPAIRLYEKLGYAEFTRTPAPKFSGFAHFVYMKKKMNR